MTFVITLGLLYIAILGFVIYRYFNEHGFSMFRRWQDRYQDVVAQTLRSLRARMQRGN